MEDTQTVFTAAFSYYTVTVISLSSLPRLGHVVPYVCPAGPAVAASLTSYSLRFIAGVTLVVLGAILRLLSFRSLGTLFTFEVAITEEHRLITSGPYAYTRHPSYTGVVFLLLGVQFIHFGLGGYVSTCDIVSTPAGFLIYVWWFCLFFVPLSLLRRCDVEDAQLHRHFGDAWLRYKKEVPYRLLPLLY